MDTLPSFFQKKKKMKRKRAAPKLVITDQMSGERVGAPKLLIKNRRFLYKLLKTALSDQGARPREIENVLNKSTCCEMKCLSEIIRNLLLGNIPVGGKKLEKLKKYGKILDLFACRPYVAVKKRKEILSAKGAGAVFLPLLFSTVLPLVLEFIAKSV